MTRKLFCLAVGALLAALALELLLRILPTPTPTSIGQHVDPHVTTYPPGIEFRTATGWSLLNAHRHRANESGFIPDRPIQASPTALAIIGDSLVEQSMLPPEQRLSALLEEMRGEPVHAMGFPGSSLFDYLERVRYAATKLEIRRFWIIVERGDVKQSLCAAKAYTDACMMSDGSVVKPARPPRSRAHELLSRSALLQYFVGVLRLSPAALLGLFERNAKPTTENPAAPVSDDLRNTPSRSAHAAPAAEEVLAIERFIEALDTFRETGIEIGLVIDPRVTRIERDEEFIDPALEAIAHTASDAHFTVIHPFEALAADARASGLSLRVGPYDGHWNVRTNCVIAGLIQIAMLPPALNSVHTTSASDARNYASCRTNP